MTKSGKQKNKNKQTKTGSLKAGQQEKARFQADGKKPHRRVDEELRFPKHSPSSCTPTLALAPRELREARGTPPGRQSGAGGCGNDWPERLGAPGPFTAILPKLPKEGVTALSGG